MALELDCRCGKRLRVADEHVGKHARCPSCGEVTLVTNHAANSSADASSSHPAVSDSPSQYPESEFPTSQFPTPDFPSSSSPTSSSNGDSTPYAEAAVGGRTSRDERWNEANNVYDSPPTQTPTPIVTDGTGARVRARRSNSGAFSKGGGILLVLFVLGLFRFGMRMTREYQSEPSYQTLQQQDIAPYVEHIQDPKYQQKIREALERSGHFNDRDATQMEFVTPPDAVNAPFSVQPGQVELRGSGTSGRIQFSTEPPNSLPTGVPSTPERLPSLPKSIYVQ